VYGHIKGESEGILRDVCNKIFTQKAYNQSTVGTLISQANDEAVRALLANNKNFKYVVLTTVMQRKQQTAPLEMGMECFWNQGTDGQSVVQWESDSMHVFMTLYALAL